MKENIAGLMAASATEHKLAVIVKFKAKYLCDESLALADKAFPETKNGYIEISVFFRYMEEIFILNVPKERPILHTTNPLATLENRTIHIENRTILPRAERQVGTKSE